MKFIIIKMFRNRDELCKFLERPNSESSFGILKVAIFIFVSILVEHIFPGSELTKNVVIVTLGLVIFAGFPRLMARRRRNTL